MCSFDADICAADATPTPQLSCSAASSPGKIYMIICLDPDAPHPSAAFLGPVLHWLQSGLQLDSSGSEVLTTSSSSEPFVSDYAPPGPPPFSPPHRYVFLLYEQPEGFDVKAHAPAEGTKMGVWARMWYSLDEWEKRAGLGKVVAANYFTSN